LPIFLAHDAVERRHLVGEALHDVRAGVQDRFADVVVVGNRRAAVGELAGGAVQILPSGAGAGAAVHSVAGEAAAPAGDGGAALGERSGGASPRGDLLLVDFLLNHPQHAVHLRVQVAAVFGAEDDVVAILIVAVDVRVVGGGHGLRAGGEGVGLEPVAGVAVGEDVLLHAEVGHPEAVDDIGGDHPQQDGGIFGHVEDGHGLAGGGD